MKLNAKTAWLMTIGVFILHFLPYLIYPGDAYIRIHDTMEGEWIWLDVMSKTNTALSFDPQTEIPQIMNGLPRSTMPTGISMMMLLVKLFGTYWAYVINYMLVHIVGFAAMFFFLQTHIFKRKEDVGLIIYISLIFSLIPVYSPFGLSVMSQPTLIHIFILALKEKAKYYHYILLLLFPLYSSLVWMGVPLLILLGLFWMYKLIKYKRIFPQYILGITVLSISYALINYNLFQLMLYPPDGFISHRTVYKLELFEGPEFGTAMLEFVHHFFTLHYHVGTMLTLPILMLGVVVYKSRHPLFKKLFILVISIVLFQAFYSYFEFYVASHVNFFKTFRLNRFNIILPVIWISALALIFREMMQNEFLKKLIPVSIVTLIITTSIGNDEILNNYRRITGGYHLPTFKEYLAPDQFTEIKNYIGKNQADYRVVGVGINPSVFQYNGFYTLDGLQSVYDLSYKLKFRKIFEQELNKNELIQQYFDGWGNRCYVYSSQLGMDWDAFMVNKGQIVSQEKLLKKITMNIDPLAFKELGGKYIFSAIELEEMPGFTKIFTSKNDKSYWTIYVYQLNE